MQLTDLLNPIYAPRGVQRPVHGGLRAPPGPRVPPLPHLNDALDGPIHAPSTTPPSLGQAPVAYLPRPSAPQGPASPPEAANTAERGLALLGYRHLERAPLRRCAQRQATARLLLFATPLLRAAGFANNAELVAVACDGGISALNALVCVHAKLLGAGATHGQLCALGARAEGAAALHAASQAAPTLIGAGLTPAQLLTLAALDVGLLEAAEISVPRLRRLHIAPELAYRFVAGCQSHSTLYDRLADLEALAATGLHAVAAGVLARDAVERELPVLMRHRGDLRRTQIPLPLVWAVLDKADAGKTLAALLERAPGLFAAGYDERQLGLVVSGGAYAIHKLADAVARSFGARAFVYGARPLVNSAPQARRAI